MASTHHSLSSTSSTDLNLPYVTVQADYVDVYNEVSQGLANVERTWVSVYCANAPRASIHAKLLLTRNRSSRVDVDLEEEFKRDLSVQRTRDSQFDLTISGSSKGGSTMANKIRSSIDLPETTLRMPKRTIGPVVQGSMGITAFDVSTTGNSMFVAAGSDGQAYVSQTRGSTSNGAVRDDDEGVEGIEALAQRRMRQRMQERSSNEQRKRLQGHVGDIRSAKFFPSGTVILTTSSDCQAKVFGLDGSNPRTLEGHRRAVMDSAFVDRGENVVTGSLDGTSRLWNVGRGAQVASFASEHFSGVNVVRLGDSTSGQDGQQALLITGLSNGTIEAHDMRSKSVSFRVAPQTFPSGPAPAASDSWEQVRSGAIESMDWNGSSHSLLAGCNNGVTLLYDARMLGTRTPDTTPDQGGNDQGLKASWKRNGAAVNDCRLGVNGHDAIIATADGTPYRVNLQGNTAKVTDEYCGWDVGNVAACGIESQHVWLAGAEGMVRMYDI